MLTGGYHQAGKTHARRASSKALALSLPGEVSRHLKLRLEKQSSVIQDISWKAEVRLCKRYRTLIARGKHVNKAVLAIAVNWWASRGYRETGSCDSLRLTTRCLARQELGGLDGHWKRRCLVGATLDSVRDLGDLVAERGRHPTEARRWDSNDG